MKTIQEINFDLPEQIGVRINGEEFAINMADHEAIEFVLGVQQKYGNLKSENIQEIWAAIQEVLGVVDRILGDGATLKIFKGRSANLNFIVDNVIQPLVGAVMGVYNNKVAEKYD